MKKKIISALLVMSALFLSSCAPSGDNGEKNSEGINVTASFYPIYIIAENVIGDTEGIVLENMAQPQTGCLHDYQLTTGDMKKLEDTDVFIINGGGMESFLDNALALFPDLDIVDTSEGVISLENDGHVHSDEDDGDTDGDLDEDLDGDTGEDLDGDGHNHEENSHFWILPQNAAIQAENICSALSEICPDKAGEFRKNTDEFIAAVKGIDSFDGDGMKVCIFNEAFAYLHLSCGFDVRLCVEMDENQTPSAREMAEIITTVKDEGITLLIAADDASKAVADTVARETDAKVIVLDPVLTGDFSKESYADALNENARILKGSVDQ